MNKRQKLVQQQFLNNEEAVIKRLEYIYDQSLTEINKKIRNLEFTIGDLTEEYDWLDDDDPKKEIIRSKIQSKIYQKQYQESLQGQLDGILKQMQTKQFLTISDYLDTCYEDGFIGSIFDMHGQNVPLMMPLDQTKMVRAIQLESKISKGLYTRLGEDVGVLKKRITSEVSRSISTGSSFAQTAQRLAGQTKIGYNKAVRIARTEGHRIQTTAAMDAMEEAKNRGADVVKQWDSTLDDVTRESHRVVDGEIREVDKPFSNGLMFPGDPSGGAAEVVNCRCALLQRARWALDEDELQTLQDRAAYFGLDKVDQFDDFKKKYLKAVDIDNSDFEVITDAMDFGYGNYTQDDYNKWWDAYDEHNKNVHLSAEELKIIDDYTEGSYIALNDVCRYSDAELLKKGYSAEDIKRIRKKADTLEGALSKYDLDTDIVTHRFERDVSWLTGNGNGIEDLENLIGKEYTTEGFTSSGMLPNRFRFTGGKKDAVHFEIITPKGTNGAFLSMSKKGENEFLYNRNTRYKVIDGGERIVKEKKLNIRTMQMEEVEIKERFLKVQVIVDDVAEAVIKPVFTPATLDDFPEYFRKNSVSKKATKTFVDTLNEAEDLNPNIRKLYTQMDKLPQVPADHSVSYTGTDHALNRWANYYTGEVNKCQLKVPKMQGENLMGQKSTAFHEMAHFIDMGVGDKKKLLSELRQDLTNVVTSSGMTIGDDVMDLFTDFRKQYDTVSGSIRDVYSAKRQALSADYRARKMTYSEYSKQWDALKREEDAERDYQCRNLCGGGVTMLSDIYDALSGGLYQDNRTLYYGHGGKYYSDPGNRNCEIFANYMSLSVNRPDLVEMLRKDKPDLCNALDQMIEEMAGGIK